MKPFTLTASTLAGAWLTLAAVTTAQTSTAQEDQLARHSAPSSPRAERAQGPITSIPMTDDRYSRTYWDTDEHGTIWVRGRNYKASFGAEGATYYPLFGSETPRHFPVALSLASATSGGQAIALEPVTGAVRDGERVIIDRGAIDEVYEIGVEGIEQTFVVEARPASDLKLFAGIATELTPAARADGFEFANEFGAVRYSQAFVRETTNSRHALASQLVEGGVAIQIDAQYLRTARFPLVVDPLITTFDVDTTTYENSYPEVAYDATSNRYLYVFAEKPNALDSDGFSLLVDASGNVLGGAYVDLTTEDWINYSVANLNAYDQFLVVVDVGTWITPTSPAIEKVKARLTNASAVSYGTAFTIADPAMRSSVGGDPYPSGPSYYCVAYEAHSGASTSIVARLVTNIGTLVGAAPVVLDPPTLDLLVFPEVSPGNGGARWNIAWQRNFTLMNSDIWGAQVEWNGGLTTPRFPIAISTADDYVPFPSSPFATGEYVVAWTRISGSENDVMASVISGATAISTQNVTVLEGGTHLLESQHLRSIDCDGQHVALLYVGATLNPPMHLSSFYSLGGVLQPSEVRIALGSGERAPVLVATASTGGAEGRFALCWANADNIYGAIYESEIGGPISTLCFGDGTGTACPCANNGSAGRGCANSANASGAQLIGLGQADLSSDTLQLSATGVTPTAPCLFFQGSTLYSSGAGLAFGDGLLCATTPIVRLGIKFAVGTNAVFPQAGDPILSIGGAIPAGGGVRYYQVWYRDAAVFCSSSTFNLTNAVKVVWLP